jgi:hypothetical protein
MSDEVNFAVLLDDFVKDAAKWREIREVVETSRSTASGVETVPFAVTDGISYAAGFREQYNTLAGWTVDYLRDGRDALEEIAAALGTTRDEYLASEEYAEWKATQG